MKILLVDDEQYVLDRLTAILRGGLPEELTVSTASDGAEALEKALASPPDLLITDVRMPRMDGMDLALQITSIAPDCKIVFLSNYSDKEYLRQAIHLHAVEYIDKPVTPERLLSLTEQLAWEHKSAKLRQRSLAEENAANARKILTQLWSQMLCGKNSNLDSVRQPCRQYGLDPFFHSGYRCLILRTDGTAVDLTALPAAARILPCDCDPQSDSQTLFLYAQEPAPLSDAQIRAIWESARLLPGVSGMAAGPAVPSCREAFASYQAALAALDRLFFRQGPHLILSQSAPEPPARPLNEEALAEFRKTLSELHTAEAQKILGQIFARLRRNENRPVSSIKNFCCKAADILLQVSAENLLDFHSQYTNTQLSQQIFRAASLQDLEALLTSWTGELLACGVGDERIIRLTIAYIRRNLPNPSLCLDEICAFTGYSKSYLCTIFKQMVGITVNNYINKTRMDQAAALLSGTAKSVKEIAQSVGIDNAKYFSRLFKSYTTLTPNEYRKSTEPA